MANGADKFNMIPHFMHEGARRAFVKDQLPREQVAVIDGRKEEFIRFVENKAHMLVEDFLASVEEKNTQKTQTWLQKAVDSIVARFNRGVKAT